MKKQKKYEVTKFVYIKCQSTKLIDHNLTLVICLTCLDIQRIHKRVATFKNSSTIIQDPVQKSYMCCQLLSKSNMTTIYQSQIYKIRPVFQFYHIESEQGFSDTQVDLRLIIFHSQAAVGSNKSGQQIVEELFHVSIQLIFI